MVMTEKQSPGAGGAPERFTTMDRSNLGTKSMPQPAGTQSGSETRLVQNRPSGGTCQCLGNLGHGARWPRSLAVAGLLTRRPDGLKLIRP